MGALAQSDPSSAQSSDMSSAGELLFELVAEPALVADADLVLICRRT